MAQTLVQFHFNPLKFGQIIRTTAKEKGVSQASMAAKTGLSYDTVGNIYGGKVQKIPFEYVFKICVVLGTSVEVVMMLMLKDEDIDFEGDVLLYDTQHDITVPVSETVPSLVAGPVTDTVAEAAIAATTAQPVADPPAGYYTIEDINRAVDQANAHHAAIVAHLTESREHLIQQHERHISDLKAQQQAERVTAERYQRLLHRLIDSVTGKQGEV
ncbi:MAG: helix-turn-helix domain-containing protein [Clostridia bacterium]|nr:helix-turn-helix domain-containing protein [Clostridia bacterium]